MNIKKLVVLLLLVVPNVTWCMLKKIATQATKQVKASRFTDLSRLPLFKEGAQKFEGELAKLSLKQQASLMQSMQKKFDPSYFSYLMQEMTEKNVVPKELYEQIMLLQDGEIDTAQEPKTQELLTEIAEVDPELVELLISKPEIFSPQGPKDLEVGLAESLIEPGSELIEPKIKTFDVPAQEPRVPTIERLKAKDFVRPPVGEVTILDAEIMSDYNIFEPGPARRKRFEFPELPQKQYMPKEPKSTDLLMLEPEFKVTDPSMPGRKIFEPAQPEPSFPEPLKPKQKGELKPEPEDYNKDIREPLQDVEESTAPRKKIFELVGPEPKIPVIKPVPEKEISIKPAAKELVADIDYEPAPDIIEPQPKPAPRKRFGMAGMVELLQLKQPQLLPEVAEIKEGGLAGQDILERSKKIWDEPLPEPEQRRIVQPDPKKTVVVSPLPKPNVVLPKKRKRTDTANGARKKAKHIPFIVVPDEPTPLPRPTPLEPIEPADKKNIPFFTPEEPAKKISSGTTMPTSAEKMRMPDAPGTVGQPMRPSSTGTAPQQVAAQPTVGQAPQPARVEQPLPTRTPSVAQPTFAPASGFGSSSAGRTQPVMGPVPTPIELPQEKVKEKEPVKLGPDKPVGQARTSKAPVRKLGPPVKTQPANVPPCKTLERDCIKKRL